MDTIRSIKRTNSDSSRRDLIQIVHEYTSMLFMLISIAIFGTCVYRFVMQYAHTTILVYSHERILTQMFANVVLLILLFVAICATVVITGQQFSGFVTFCIIIGTFSAEIGNYILKTLQ